MSIRRTTNSYDEKTKLKQNRMSHIFFIPCYFTFQMYRDLSMVARDGMVLAWTRINQLVIEKFIKLQEVTRTQVNIQFHWYSIQLKIQ